MSKRKTNDSEDSDDYSEYSDGYSEYSDDSSFYQGILLSDSDNEDEDPDFYLIQCEFRRACLVYLTHKKNPSTFDQATILFDGKEDTQAFLNVRADFPREDEMIVILGFFSDFSGPEYDSFLFAAYKLQNNYHFCITKKPPPEPDHDHVVVRWFNFLDHKFEHIKITDDDDMVKYVEEKSTPYYTIYNLHPRRLVNKFLYSGKNKVVLFIDLDRADAEYFQIKFGEVAKRNRGKGTLFMLGGLDAIQPLASDFGSTKSKEPRIVFKDSPSEIYVKEGLKADDIETWVEKNDKDGDSLPISLSPLKFIHGTVAFVEEVLHCGKNVFLVLYGSRQRNDRLELPVELLSLLLDLAVHFEKENETDKEVVVAIMSRWFVVDAIQGVKDGNRPPNGEFLEALDPDKIRLHACKNPTLCFQPAKGDLMLYDYKDDINVQDIIRYVKEKKTAEQPKRETPGVFHTPGSYTPFRHLYAPSSS